MQLLANVAHDGVSVSVSGILIGLLLAACVWVLGVFIAQETGLSVARPLAAILAVLVFLVLAFDF